MMIGIVYRCAWEFGDDAYWERVADAEYSEYIENREETDGDYY